MIKGFSVKNHLGEKLHVELASFAETGLVVKTIDGLGPAKGNINMTDNGIADGTTYNSSRLDNRNIVFTFAFQDVPDIETVRQRTYKYFPIKKPVELEFFTDNRQLKTTGYVESNDPTIFSSEEGTVISILCPDPYLYASGSQSLLTTVMSGHLGAFEFPFSNESLTEPLMEFGHVVAAEQKLVRYDGDAPTGFEIYIHALGPATMITLTNVLTQKYFKIDTAKLSAVLGGPIMAGDDIYISTLRGEKRIYHTRDGLRRNILNAVDRESSWLDLVQGDNVFAVVTTSGAENLQIEVVNRTSYQGV